MGVLRPGLVCLAPAPLLPGQVRGGGSGPGWAGEGSSPMLRARPAGKVRAAGRGWRARRGQRGGEGRGRRPRHLIKRLRVSREQRAHSAVGSCLRGGAARQRARLVPGVGPDAAAAQTRVAAAAAARQPRTRPGAQGGRRIPQPPAPFPVRRPSHGGRGAAVAALPVGGAPAPAWRCLQLGHPRGQCDPENGGPREPLRLLAGHALATAARG